MTTALELACGDTGSGPAVVLVHGLLGNGRNLQPLAQALANRHRVLTPDLRNHGRSPHSPVMDYPALAADLIALLDRHGIEKATLIGHSLGGKAVMATTLLHPERAIRLAVLDMAPVSYREFLGELLQTLEQMPLTEITNRNDADDWLAQQGVANSRLRAFLLQNLSRSDDGFRWRVNLDVLLKQRQTLTDFPDDEPAWDGPTLFLHGADSDYVLPEHHEAIRRLFPQAGIEAIANAGHWLHADQPDTVAKRLRTFLET
ncbi:pimeloyl-ACP methyl ester carboxylesterase [Methylohalomonas lacus]|uniref:Pimeloyl-ACP methyl ester carboxylesterase n=1 Tax=Methylohalomonas lacus TaxID=398773 RepID=A0AAE3HI88_9GAMM|nr:alpha/beta fold hydrolase [Methylohalomonas lacus]MCS3902841.1 pimeloyl-ACP methyl ester carboxylesterase [Methylohalomonas lacus]